MASARRDTTKVIHDILLLARQAISKTQLIFRANLSFELAERHISFLLSKGHLQVSIDHHGTHRYETTAKGNRLLTFLGEIERELEGFIPIVSGFAGGGSHQPAVPARERRRPSVRHRLNIQLDSLGSSKLSLHDKQLSKTS